MLELDLVLVMDALEDLTDLELSLVMTYCQQLQEERAACAPPMVALPAELADLNPAAPIVL